MSSTFEKKMTDDELLARDFDPSSLTIPQLKSTLSKFGVELPGKQEKKAFYIALYRTQITAKANAIRAKQRKVKPSAEGITAVSTRGSLDYKETERLKSMARERSFSTANPFQNSGTDEEDEPNRRRTPRKSPAKTAQQSPLAVLVI